MKQDDQAVDVLFLSLTRPPLTWGVPFEAFWANLILTFFLGMWLGSPLYWFVGIFLHFPLRIISSRDHNFFRVGRLWLQTKGRGGSGRKWGGSMLSPLPSIGQTATKDRASCV